MLTSGLTSSLKVNKVYKDNQTLIYMHYSIHDMAVRRQPIKISKLTTVYNLTRPPLYTGKTNYTHSSYHSPHSHQHTRQPQKTKENTPTPTKNDPPHY